MSTREERIQELRAEMDRRTDRAFRAAPTWRTQARRRGLVVVTVAVLLAAAVVAHVLGRASNWYLLGGLLAVTILMAGLRVLTRGVAESGDNRLDEHDRALRDRALRRSFFFGPGLLVVVVFYLNATGQEPDLAARVTQLLLVVIVALSCVPTMLLAWTLPDDDPDDLA